jgi:hypothetical protein
MKYFTLTLLFCFLYTAPVKSQETPMHQKLTTKKKLVIGGLAVQQVASFGVQYKWWWKDDYHAFTFENDGFVNNYCLGVDKLGHFFTSYLYFHSLNELLTYADFSPKTRRITSVALPLAWAVSIEIGDGFSSYGYSWADLAANSLGVGFGLLQERYPAMRKVKMKMSYYPTARYTDNGFKDWSLTSDYMGHCYWLSFDVHNLLPQQARRYWPEFLNMAVGYGIDRNTPVEVPPHLRDFCIGFDWNLSCIKTKRKSTHVVKELLDYFHYPAPGIGKVQGEATRFIFFR